MKQRRSFVKYIKDNNFWMVLIITILAGFIGIYSFLDEVPLMGWFMVLVLAVTWAGSFVDWKAKG